MDSKAKQTTKQSAKPRAYLLRGDDEVKKRQELDTLLASLVSPDFADFDLEQLEGDSATAERIIAGLNVPPFASNQRVVLVRYANKIPPPEQEKLASMLQQTNESACLILVNPAAEKVDGKPRKGSEVTGDLSKAVRKIGVVRDFGKMKVNDAIQFAQSVFSQARKRIDSGAVRAFVQRVGADSSVITTEAQKLIDHAGNADTISMSDIASVTSETPEEKVFKLVDAISTKSQAEAFRLLDELFATGDNPDADAPRTLSTIARQFRLLWQIKMLNESGVRGLDKDSVPGEMKANLPTSPNVLDVVSRQSWMVDRLVRQARPFSHDELVRCFNAISAADMMLKGIEGNIEDSRMVMELLIIELVKSGRKRE